MKIESSHSKIWVQILFVSWAESVNKLFTVLGGKLKFSAQDSDLEYASFWRSKNPPLSFDLMSPLVKGRFENNT